MLAPTTIASNKQFRPWGTAPAVSLTRNLPRDGDADVLVLEGDIRNLLYTAYTEQDLNKAELRSPTYDDLPQRKLDVTWCEAKVFNIARNVILLTILHDDEAAEYGQGLWAMFHSAFINEHLWKRILQSIDKLAIIKTWNDWCTSKYGQLIRFCDTATFQAVRRHIDSMITSREDYQDDANHYWENLRRVAANYENQDAGALHNALDRAGLRSAGPLGIQTADEIISSFKAGWSTSTIDNAKARHLMPNPLFKPLAEPGVSLDVPLPILGFHLATTFAPLTDSSPLRPVNADLQLHNQDVEFSKAVQTAALQFSTWAEAFSQMSDNIAVRFAAAEPLAFCQALQTYCSTGALTAGWPNNQYQSLVLDDVEYGSQKTAPKRFDTIETGDVLSNVGGLNILVSASPLLKNSVSATLFTDVDVERDEGQKDVFEKVFLGSASETGLLLGLTLIEYFTDATVTSSVDELFAKQGDVRKVQPKQHVRLRLSWKRSHQLAGARICTERPSVEAEISTTLFKIYKRMLQYWTPFRARAGRGIILAQNATIPPYHAGSLVALIKAAQGQINAPWDDVCSRLHLMMQSYEEADKIPDFNLEFAALSKLWGVYQPLFPELREDRKLRGFNDWDQIPDIVVVNIQVSGDLFKNIFDGTASFPTLSITVASYYEDASSKQDTFASLSYNFGKIELRPDDSFSIVNGNDRITPASDGRFDMIISFYAPSHILQLDPRPTSFTIQTYDKDECRPDSTVIGDIGDTDKILVTHMLPGLSEEPNSSIHPQVGTATSIAHPETCVGTDQEENDEVDTNFTLAPLSPSVVKPLDLPYSVGYSLKVDEQLEKVVGMVAHVSIKSQEGKDLLLIDRCVVTLRQESPFMVRVLFANSTYTPMCVFPLPIILDKASKPRVARQSSWVEFIVLVVDPVTAASSADIVFPNQISAAGDIVSLNLPYINMDILPILDLTDKERIGFLTTLASMQFSAKERVLREEAQASTDTGIMPSARANFKETVMTMFMLASGVQGGQSGLMALNVEGGQGIHMLFFVSAVRLDGPTSSVILDAAVIPVTSAMLLDSTFGEFLMVLRHFEIATLIVNEDELRLWKQVLPAMVERCRAWPHSNDCVYRKVHQAPVSTDHGQLVLCDCGKGKLPPGFVTAGLPGWDKVGVHHATRVAISPTFAVPLIEDLVSTENLIKMQASRLSTTQDHCVNCGATESIGGGRLKKCTRCHRVQYCSTVCQKKDWSKHRPECLEYQAAGS